MARTILHENNLPNYFWAEAINTSCYILNRVLIRSSLDKTPYELWKNKKPNISYFKVFEILRTTLENLMQNLMLGYILAILHLVKPKEFSTKRQWS